MVVNLEIHVSDVCDQTGSSRYDDVLGQKDAGLGQKGTEKAEKAEKAETAEKSEKSEKNVEEHLHRPPLYSVLCRPPTLNDSKKVGCESLSLLRRQNKR